MHQEIEEILDKRVSMVVVLIGLPVLVQILMCLQSHAVKRLLFFPVGAFNLFRF